MYLSEALGVGRAGAVAAHQGDGAADKAHQRMHVQPPGDQQTEDVLQEQEGNQHDDELQQTLATLLEHAEVGRQAHRREEGQ
ncbi:hypothetical protein D3C81_1387340 [compost metagenome]